jgi:hypothetical protein
MAVTNANYYAMFPLQETIWAKDGTGPLAGGIIEFFSDPAFTVPKDVYEQSNQAPYSFVNIGPTLILSGIGSFVDNSGENFIPMLYPWSLPPTNVDAPGDYQPYFIRVYSSGMILEFTVTQWPPNNWSINNTAASSSGITTNQITNPQFPEMSFTGTLVTALSANTITVPFAPGWFITASGTGNMTLLQNALSLQTPSEAPYSIDITLDAGVSAIMYQRIYDSPRLFAGNFVSGYFEAASPANSNIFLTMTYKASDNLIAPILITSGTTSGTAYTEIKGSVLIPSTVASADAPPGYVDIQIAIPAGIRVQITSVQLLAVELVTDIPAFEQISVPIQQSLLYWYDRSPLMYKQIPSYLVGWDFPLNPAQPLGSTVGVQSLGTNTSYYAWDQTIIYQTQTAAVSVARNTSGAMELTMAKTDQIAVIQYLDQTQAREILEQPMCVNVCGSSSASTKLAVSLWYTKAVTLPDIKTGSSLSIVASLDANGVPGGTNETWIQVPRGKLGNGYATLAPLTVTGYTSIPLSGWALESHTEAALATYFAIVIGTPSVALGATISLESVSLQSGTIATRPAPQTEDEVLRECEYYYEKSYDNDQYANAVSGAVTSVGAIIAPQQVSASVGGYAMYAAPFSLTYNTIKRATPSITTLVLYSTSGVINSVLAAASDSTTITPSTSDQVSTFWTGTYGTKTTNFTNSTASSVQSTPGAVATGIHGWIKFQYVVDCRLGVI